MKLSGATARPPAHCNASSPILAAHVVDFGTDAQQFLPLLARPAQWVASRVSTAQETAARTRVSTVAAVFDLVKFAVAVSFHLGYRADVPPTAKMFIRLSWGQMASKSWHAHPIVDTHRIRTIH